MVMLNGSCRRGARHIKHHAAWLMTPRDDLGGVCPREVALAQRNHLTWDLQHQEERWSLLRKCPPGLDKSSFAFRHGGFGIHELVLYYELLRELLSSCQERLVHLGDNQSIGDGPEAFTFGDFLTSEVPRLESFRDASPDKPDPEYHGRTPRSIIDREPSRLPEGMSGHDAIVDPDCPCCQMMADMPGPMFWHLTAAIWTTTSPSISATAARNEAERREWDEQSAS